MEPDSLSGHLTYWSGVRFDATDKAQGWCGHAHRHQDRAVACVRALNRSWGHSDETWRVERHDEPTGSRARELARRFGLSGQ